MNTPNQNSNYLYDQRFTPLQPPSSKPTSSTPSIQLSSPPSVTIKPNLQSWLRDYDKQKPRVKNSTPTVNLKSAFARPTFVPAPAAPAAQRTLSTTPLPLASSSPLQLTPAISAVGDSSIQVIPTSPSGASRKERKQITTSFAYVRPTYAPTSLSKALEGEHTQALATRFAAKLVESERATINPSMRTFQQHQAIPDASARTQEPSTKSSIGASQATRPIFRSSGIVTNKETYVTVPRHQRQPSSKSPATAPQTYNLLNTLSETTDEDLSIPITIHLSAPQVTYLLLLLVGSLNWDFFEDNLGYFPISREAWTGFSTVYYETCFLAVQGEGMEWGIIRGLAERYGLSVDGVAGLVGEMICFFAGGREGGRKLLETVASGDGKL